MEAIAAILIAPVIVFLVIVAPIWLLLYYWTRRREANAMTADHENLLGQMARGLERMEDRIGALEKILDAEDPRWREKGPTSDHL
jgi:phage shock protein B